MRKLSLRVRVYVISVIAAGAGAVGVACVFLFEEGGFPHVAAPINSPHSVFTIGLFLVVDGLASAAIIWVPEEGGQKSAQSLGAVGVLSTVLVFPVFAAILLTTVSRLGEELTNRREGRGRQPLYAALFNASSTTLQTGAAALIFLGLGGNNLLLMPDLPQDAPRLLLAVCGAVVASYLLSYGLTIGVVSLNSGRSFRDVFLQSHRNTLLPESTAAVVGILFGYLWLVNPPLAPIALMPLAVIYLAFKSFIRLQELDRLKSNFITEVSHELRTPLSAILASNELLYHHADRLNGENVRELSRSSYESSNHLFRLVENLLNATTLQSGTLHIRPVSVSLDELIGDAVVQVGPFLESKRQSISVDVPEDLPEVLADPQHIIQVLINLLTNASKYSNAETLIAVSCSTENDLVRIAVTDQGIGIPEEEQRHIFERFYRVPSNTMTSVVGSGLGLTIVKALVELHRGRVGVTSAPGSGSIFWFTLPQVSMAAT